MVDWYALLLLLTEPLPVLEAMVEPLPLVELVLPRSELLLPELPDDMSL